MNFIHLIGRKHYFKIFTLVGNYGLKNNDFKLLNLPKIESFFDKKEQMSI